MNSTKDGRNSNSNDDFDLDGVPAKVTKVNFDGLLRTKQDFIKGVVGDVFQAKNFGELVERISFAQEKLRNLEVFKDVAVIIDVDKSVEDYKAGDEYEVTFVVKEFGRIALSVKTEMGAQADAQLKAGVRMPNIFGRGERLELESAHSSVKEENAQLSFIKPFPLLDSSMKIMLSRAKVFNTHADFVNTAIGGGLAYYSALPKTRFVPPLSHKLEYEGTWRKLTPGSSNTPYGIHFRCGHSFKSAIRSVLSLDTRDGQMFPKRGFLFNMLQEFAGFGGDVKYMKVDMDYQHNYSLPMGMTFQSSFRSGFLSHIPLFSDLKCTLPDRFFMGGPSSLRGFHVSGVQIARDGASLGGLAYWSTAAHLYMPLFYLNRKFPLVENCRLHTFVNAGNLTEQLLAGNALTDIRAAYGFGLAVGFGNFGRFEINYCFPFRTFARDKAIHGLQVGIGVHFL